MELYSRDAVLSLGCLCRLVSRALPKIFFPWLPSLQTKTTDEHLNPPTANVTPELPQDILVDIFAQLEVPDLVRAGLVCSSWHAAYTSLCSSGRYRQHQTPCLLYTSESCGASAVGLYSLAEKKAYTLTLPDPPIQSRHIIGSSYGWIITVDEMCQVHLVNPITTDQIVLPSVTTIEQVKPIFDDAGAVCKYEYSWYTGAEILADSPSIFVPSKLRDYLFYKAFLSSDPSTGDCFVVLIHNPGAQLSFARPGDEKWTWLPPHAHYEDCLFQGGYMYACNCLGEIHAFDLRVPAIKQKVVLGQTKDYSFERIYIVHTPCGELLQIWRSGYSLGANEEVESDSDFVPELGDDEEAECDADFEPVFDDDETEVESELDEEEEAEVESELEEEEEAEVESELDDDEEAESEPECDTRLHKTNAINVHKVDIPSNKLVEIRSMGEIVLFLGRNQSVCLRAEDYPQLKANHVYFNDDNDLYIMWCKNKRRDIGVFDLKNNSIEEVVPSSQLWSNSPTPVWLIPNPRRLGSNG